MNANFQVQPLPRSRFSHLFGLTDEALLRQGAQRCIVDAMPGYPCRVSLRDASVGERVILLHFEHHRVNGPYRASGAIYVRELAEDAAFGVGEVPEMLLRRPQSLRAYGANGCLLAADVHDGAEVPVALHRLFANDNIAYVHAHNARPGCFNCNFVRI